MRRLNPNLHPKDGFWFEDKDGVKVRGDTWAGVIARVARYRQRAGYPLGNPAEEVTAQACGRNPVICQDESPAAATQLRKTNLKGRVLAWMNLARQHRAEGRLEFVDAATAAARADICARCQFNTALPDGCASCRAALNELRREVLGRRTVDKRLNGCVVLGEDLPTAAHLERASVDDAELPANCWRKRTL